MNVVLPVILIDAVQPHKIAAMDNMESPLPLKSARQVAEYLQVSARKFEQMVRAGDAPSHLKFGRLRRWRIEDVVAWVAARSNPENEREPNHEGGPTIDK